MAAVTMMTVMTVVLVSVMSVAVTVMFSTPIIWSVGRVSDCETGAVTV